MGCEGMGWDGMAALVSACEDVRMGWEGGGEGDGDGNGNGTGNGKGEGEWWRWRFGRTAGCESGKVGAGERGTGKEHVTGGLARGMVGFQLEE